MVLTDFYSTLAGLSKSESGLRMNSQEVKLHKSFLHIRIFVASDILNFVGHMEVGPHYMFGSCFSFCYCF